MQLPVHSTFLMTGVANCLIDHACENQQFEEFICDMEKTRMIRLVVSFLVGLINEIPLVIIAGVLNGNYDSDEPVAKLLSSFMVGMREDRRATHVTSASLSSIIAQAMYDSGLDSS